VIALARRSAGECGGRAAQGHDDAVEDLLVRGDAREDGLALLGGGTRLRTHPGDDVQLHLHRLQVQVARGGLGLRGRLRRDVGVVVQVLARGADAPQLGDRDDGDHSGHGHQRQRAGEQLDAQ
jgi:hypothetical protein